MSFYLFNLLLFCIFKNSLNIPKGVIKVHNLKKYRQHNGKKKKDRQHNGKKKKDRQHNDKKEKEKQRSAKHYTEN